MVRTIEDVLELCHLNINDAYQRPMTHVFDLNQAAWTYNAITPAPIAKELLSTPSFHDAQSAAYWARQTRGFDWSVEDRVPAVLFKQILWKGLTGGLPYPAMRSGQDLSRDRAAVLKARSIRFLYQGQLLSASARSSGLRPWNANDPSERRAEIRQREKKERQSNADTIQ